MRASYGTTEHEGTDCAGEPSGFHGEHGYSRGGGTGRLRCDTDDTGERSLIWTDDRLAIEVMAFQGNDPPEMLDWWRNDVGPSCRPPPARVAQPAMAPDSCAVPVSPPQLLLLCVAPSRMARIRTDPFRTFIVTE